MRTIDPILESALANQQGDIILRVNTWNNQADYNANPSTPDHTWTCKAFNLYSTSANAELVTANDYALSDFTVFTIERGVLLSGVEYTIESGLMFVRTYQEDYGTIKITGSSYPNMKISIAGDDTYQNVIEAFCAEIGKTAVFKNSTDAWLGYQFFATGKGLSLNKAELFENLLKQKYTIMVYEESPNNLVFYTQDSYPSSALNAVETDGTKMLAVATAGANGGMTSLNSADWIPQTLPSFYNDVTYSPTLALWVAVGADVCATSPDGTTWTARTIPAGTYNSIAWSASQALFVAAGNVIATSPDGITWTAITVNLSTIKWDSGTVLPETRYQHTATLLADGRILLTGGISGSTQDDKTYFGTILGNTITYAAGTVLPQINNGHTATLLADGRILLTGGIYAGSLVNNTYFCTISGNTITYAAGTALPEARIAHTATLLADGRILLTGGTITGSTNNKTYFCTISGNTITYAAGTVLPENKSGHTATLLADGRILLTGGYDTAVNNKTYFCAISGNTITYAAGTVLPEVRYQHKATLLADGRILLTGGYDTAVNNKTYFCTISGNTITYAAGTVLPENKRGHTATLLADGRILLTGGAAGTETDKTYLIDMFYKSICFSNSNFVTTGNNFAQTSTNGTTWTTRTIPAGAYKAITDSGSLYIAVGADVCATSPDGTTWTARTIPAGTYYGIAYSSALSLWVAVGTDVCATSPDGTTWTARTPANLNTWRDVIYSNTLSLFIAVASDGINRIMFSADGISWSSTTANADFDLSYDDGPASYLNRDQSAVHYLWRDETASLHTDGDLTNPQWNLGYLESTDAPPSTKEDAYYKIYLKKAPVRLDITDSDKIHFTPYWSIDPTRTIDAMMTISEHLNLTKSPAWYQEIKSISIFAHTEGGALPSTIERVAAYTPLVSTGFDGNLSPAVNNLQALAQAVDDMTLGATPAWGAITGTLSAQTDLQTALNSKQASDSDLTAIAALSPANDDIIQRKAGAWVNRTVAQYKTDLGYREILTAARTYYVRTDGNDSNTGLVNNSGGAFLTLQKAINVASGNLDIGIYDVTIQLAAGTYSTSIGNVLKTCIGSGKVIIIGDETTPANVVIHCTSTPALFLYEQAGTTYSLRGLKLTSTGSAAYGMRIRYGAALTFQNLNFGSLAGAQAIRADDNGIIEVTGNYAISGGCGFHILLNAGGRLRCQSKTITITGTPAWSSYFLYAAITATVIANGNTYSGSATGARYSVETNAVVYTTGGATYFPGNAAGSTATGGQYL